VLFEAAQAAFYAFGFGREFVLQSKDGGKLGSGGQCPTP
jgi:hypothetical protein